MILTCLSLSQVHSKQAEKEVVPGLYDQTSVHLGGSSFSNFPFSHFTLVTLIQQALSCPRPFIHTVAFA